MKMLKWHRVCGLLCAAVVVIGMMGCTCGVLSGFRSATNTTGYTYVPLDPFPVSVEWVVPGNYNGPEPHLSYLQSEDILRLLPDNAVRMSVEHLHGSGNATYGPASVGLHGEIYRVTVDYINADTTTLRVWVRREQSSAGHPPKYDVLSDTEYMIRFEPYEGSFATPGTLNNQVEIQARLDEEKKHYSQYNIPLYVGIGLRITADVRVTGGKANISGLGVLGFEAEAGNVNGSLVIQTLGVNGQAISASLPIQSELNRTTTQNAVVAVGSIKALLHEDETVVYPRVVGMYLPFEADKTLVNAIVSKIAHRPSPWQPPEFPKAMRLQASDDDQAVNDVDESNLP